MLIESSYYSIQKRRLSRQQASLAESRYDRVYVVAHVSFLTWQFYIYH